MSIFLIGCLVRNFIHYSTSLGEVGGSSEFRGVEENACNKFHELCNNQRHSLQRS